MTCRKLTIDRSKTPEKLGTLKDISFYGSFQFQPCGGHTRPVAGSTGETTNEDIPLSSCSTANRNDCPNYSVNFIQHANSAQQPATHCFKPVTPQIQRLIPCGYALKTGGAKHTVFAQQQKEIMIEYYNRQAKYGIRADTGKCAATMRERGLEALKDSQIKSWWSFYHQKCKREMERMAQHLQTACEGTTASSNQPASTTQPTRSVLELSASLPTQTTATCLGTSTWVPSQIPSPVITQSVVTTPSHHTSSVCSASARTFTQPTRSNSVISTAGPWNTTAPASVASVSFTSTRIQNQPT